MRPLAVILAAVAILAALLVLPLAPVAVEGQTIPPMQATSTPGPYPTPGPDACWQPYCAPPIQTPAPTATPAVEPGTGDNGATGPGIPVTPAPQPLGLPNMAYLHFMPLVGGAR